MKLAILPLLLFAFIRAAHAGDALAIGYNKDGIWTAVIYYASSTPKGGADYKNEADARAAAIADLKKKASEGMVRTEILSASDRTGHFAYGRGKRAGEKTDVHAVGFGATKGAAENDVLDQLNRQGAKQKQQIIYRYFSHGSDSPAAAAKR